MENEDSSLDRKCSFISFRRREAGNPIIVQIKYSNMILEYYRMNRMERNYIEYYKTIIKIDRVIVEWED